jgi:hypothetical protein
MSESESETSASQTPAASEPTPEQRPKERAAAAPPPPPTPVPFPILPDPIQQITQTEHALKILVEQEKRLREELATKDPLEDVADTINYANQLLNLVLAIQKVMQERDAAIRRLAGRF